MSWTNRLKKAVAGEAEPAPQVARLAPAIVAPVDAKALGRAELVELLRSDLAEISEGKLALDEIDPSGHLFDFGYVDSLSAVVLLARIEDRFGIRIEDLALIESLTSVNAIADRIERGE
jgi:acyl carrier protein